MFDLSKVVLGSSSEFKLNEYKSFGWQNKIIKLDDAKEVLGTQEEVAIYKAINFGSNILVEDTSFDIEGFDVGVNIKHLKNQIVKNQN